MSKSGWENFRAVTGTHNGYMHTPTGVIVEPPPLMEFDDVRNLFNLIDAALTTITPNKNAEASADKTDLSAEETDE